MMLVAVLLLLAPATAGANQFVYGFVHKLETNARSALKAGDVKRANELFVEYYDMTNFGKRCLIDHWDEFTKPDRDLYVDLLEKNLRKRMSEKMLLTKNDTNFKLSIKKVEKYGNGLVVVTNTLSTTRGDFKLTMYLEKKSPDYKLVDYELEGALLSRNYRGHFNFLIDKYGKEGFLERLAQKIQPNY